VVIAAILLFGTSAGNKALCQYNMQPSFIDCAKLPK
jgi:hypothetical protein